MISSFVFEVDQEEMPTLEKLQRLYLHGENVFTSTTTASAVAKILPLALCGQSALANLTPNHPSPWDIEQRRLYQKAVDEGHSQNKAKSYTQLCRDVAERFIDPKTGRPVSYKRIQRHTIDPRLKPA